MTYFGFLLRFLFIPIGFMLLWTLLDARRGKQLAAMWRGWPAWSSLLLHVVIAVVYTTPWDNYLVATKVWWYDPQLVTGLVLGWVPIEEYTFFVVQPILAGLWLLMLMRQERAGEQGSERAGERGSRLRTWVVGGTAVVWFIMVGILIAGWKPGTYLALELGWALPPIMLQLAFGADILWRQRRVVLGTIVPMTLYLSAADALAIGWGTWTIDPEQSLHFLLGGVLPIEELIFFLLTNTLLTFGMTLLLSVESHKRIVELRQKWLSARRQMRLEA
jgi:lycopene cyclase domain-containing protein